MSGRYKLYFGGFLVTSILLVGAGLMAVLDGLAVLTSGAGLYYGETFLLLAMAGRAAEWLVAGVVLGLFAVVFFVAGVVSVLRTTSLPTSSRAASLVERLEHRYPALRRFDVAEKVEPGTDERAEKLKRQYVEGEISEQEFEREMERTLDDDSGSRDYRNVEIE